MGDVISFAEAIPKKVAEEHRDNLRRADDERRRAVRRAAERRKYYKDKALSALHLELCRIFMQEQPEAFPTNKYDIITGPTWKRMIEQLYVARAWIRKHAFDGHLLNPEGAELVKQVTRRMFADRTRYLPKKRGRFMTWTDLIRASPKIIADILAERAEREDHEAQTLEPASQG